MASRRCRVDDYHRHVFAANVHNTQRITCRGLTMPRYAAPASAAWHRSAGRCRHVTDADYAGLGTPPNIRARPRPSPTSTPPPSGRGQHDGLLRTCFRTDHHLRNVRHPRDGSQTRRHNVLVGNDCYRPPAWPQPHGRRHVDPRVRCRHRPHRPDGRGVALRASSWTTAKRHLSLILSDRN